MVDLHALGGFFSPADVALVLGVVAISVALAYVHSPIAKSVIYMLPASGPIVPREYFLALASKWAVYIPIYVFLNLADRKNGRKTA